ncbi:MAG: putative MetA-pathway of phenol degradation [Rhodospirillales bacterium]|nr:putative MetA-pathway of phenol degradation [Rhodospirillales bacterium]
MPDKSAYTLFNPTPDDQMRAFAPDRPTKITGPTTVDAGHFQIETDIFNYTYDRRNDQRITTKSSLWFDPTLKLGLTNDIDAEVTLTPYLKSRASDQRSGDSTQAEGIGDTVLRLKINLEGNDGGDFALAVLPYVKLPTAAANLGNNQLEAGILLPMTYALGSDFTVAYQTSVNWLKDNFDNGLHWDFQNTLTLGHPVLERASVFVELFHEIGIDKGARSIITADLAAAYLLTDNLQIDAGVNFGITRAAPDTNIYVGIALRL